VASGSLSELRSFLDIYPNGADAKQIRRYLRLLESPTTWNPRPLIIAAGALAVVLVAGAILFWVKTARPPPIAEQSAAAIPSLPALTEVSPPIAQPTPVAKMEPITPPAPLPQPAPSAQPASGSSSATKSTPAPGADAIAWSVLQGTTDEDSLKRFVAQYPASHFRNDAEARIAALAEAARTAAVNQIEITRSMQLELKRVGCYGGDVNGQFDDATKAAWHSFSKLASVTLPDEPTSGAIKALRAIDKRVCPLLCPTGQHVEGDLCVANAPPPKRGSTEAEPSRPAPMPRPAAPRSHAKCFSFQGSKYCE